MSYARGTEVSPERSQSEIQRVLQRFGAERFGVMQDRRRAFVMFTYDGLNIQISVSIPEFDQKRYGLTPVAGRQRSDTAARREWEKDVRQRWRALLREQAQREQPLMLEKL